MAMELSEHQLGTGTLQWPRSQLHYPNKVARVYLQALEDVLGRNGLHTVLRRAHLAETLDTRPADDLQPKFDFADFASINQALEDIYGLLGARGLAQRAGRLVFDQALSSIELLAGMRDPTFQQLSLAMRLAVGLPAITEVWTQISDQTGRVQPSGSQWLYEIDQCPECWWRRATRPICFAITGMLQEGLRWIAGDCEFRVEETACIATGVSQCRFTIETR